MTDKLIQLGIGGACLAVMFLLLRLAIVRLVVALTEPLRRIAEDVRHALLTVTRIEALINPRNVQTMQMPATHVIQASTTKLGTCTGCGEPTDFACSDCAIENDGDGKTIPVCPRAECRRKHDEVCAHSPTISFRKAH